LRQPVPQYRLALGVRGRRLAPLLLLPILLLRLPESEIFALTGRAPERVAIAGAYHPKAVFAREQFIVTSGTCRNSGAASVQGWTNAGHAVAVGGVFRACSSYIPVELVPTVLNDLGASVSEAAAIGSMLQVAACAEPLRSAASSTLLVRAGLVYFAACSRRPIGQLGHSVVFVTLAIFPAGFCIVGGQIAANALPRLLSDVGAATGVGWALASGVGSIVEPCRRALLTRNGARDRVHGSRHALCARRWLRFR